MSRKLLCLLCLACSPGTAQDWPALRGNLSTGTQGSSLLKSGTNFALKVRWREPIGSGYSSVVVADGRVVTMHVDGENDVVACRDAKTGRSLWKVPVGPTFKGANGSFDGPLSTPTIHERTVYALSPRGRLVSVDLKSGDLNWSRDLAKEESARQPLYGFTTSPVIAGGHVVIQLGAKDKHLLGLGLASGKTVWHVGNDQVSSQTPTVYRVGDREIVLASAGKFLTGVDPVNGKQLFEVEHGGGDGSAVTPVNVGNGRMLLTVDDSFSTAFDIKVDGRKVSAKNAWKNRSIKNTYNIPVSWKDSVYGFSTRFLTCIDPSTGNPRWKNRKPGDGFLIAVDDHLLITTKKGSVHVARASASAYEEVVALKVFEKLNWSVPAFADNAIFSRSFNEIARVDIVQTGKQMASSPDASEHPTGPKFTAFLEYVAKARSAKERTELVDSFVKKQKAFPIMEGNIVQFVYRGECRDVALASDIFGARQEQRMQNVAGTDLYYYSLQLPEDQRANYVFLVDYKVQSDERNPRSTVSTMYAGEMEFAVRLQKEQPLRMSWFAMPGWKEPKFLAEARKEGRKLSGTIESHEVATDDQKSKFPIDVYLPPQYEDTNKRFPVVYMQNGKQARERLPKLIDAICAGGMKNPPVVVFLKAAFNPMAPGVSVSEHTAKFVVPFVDKTYRTNADRSARGVYGTGFTGSDAFGLAGGNPELFGLLYVQSPLVFDGGQAQFAKLFEKIQEPMKICIEWGSYDMHNPHENWDVRKIGKSMADRLSANKQLKVTERSINDSTDWRSWQGQLHNVLEFLTTL